MKPLRVFMILAVLILAAAVQQAPAQGKSLKETILLGTTGACNNPVPGQPCTQQSTLVQLDPQTGALIRTIGDVGFTVNGLAWDGTSGKLYATTPPGDVTFHGLITINLNTGAGKPVDKKVVNFGLSGDDSPVHSITIDLLGRMVGWYDEFAPPGAPPVTDTFVQIDQHTGVATEFPSTGIDTHQNGLSFSDFNILWNIDGTRRNPDGTTTQTAYLIDPSDGKPICSRQLTPPTAAALGDFNPASNLYYGLTFDSGSFTPPFPTSIVVVNPRTGTVTPLGPTVDDLHTLAFVGPRK
jgi:hypothetical protein